MSRFLRSFVFAWSGIRSAASSQANMKFHLAAAIVVNAAGLLIGLSRLEWLAIVIVQGMVLAAETMNTAIEHVVDLASPQEHPLAKAAKDTAAGAVLITAITAVIVGLFVFGPHVLP
ncbi:diacylglycerol kinase family protein [Paenibacillus rhizovicinus]|uniref:Diacylglycerol kinase family protein n=1 Tax=Paenibacillus rhizovicinus TaxID=2704463 RepID=A0A6C0NW49_9BACL|nr:diacylglycerol kinase family protein [Paenibacillus rhizovicinus]QHW30430.1 diacylglycerol kinase family protein [Paenibacillus rhizovicinus]